MVISPGGGNGFAAVINLKKEKFSEIFSGGGGRGRVKKDRQGGSDFPLPSCAHV